MLYLYYKIETSMETSLLVALGFTGFASVLLAAVAVRRHRANITSKLNQIRARVIEAQTSDELFEHMVSLQKVSCSVWIQSNKRLIKEIYEAVVAKRDELETK